MAGANGQLVYNNNGSAAGATAYFDPATGNVGLGTNAPEQRLHVIGRGAFDVGGLGGIDISTPGGWPGIIFTESTEGKRREVAVKSDGMYLAVSNDSSAPDQFNGVYIYEDGVVRVKVLMISGGADLSEGFDIQDSREYAQPLPGMVVSIDPENQGYLTISEKAYDRRVAGIISGAGGVNLGMLMGQQATIASGSHPVALSGRVYCKADTINGSIEPGDLLTTSDTQGHAMKVTDYSKAQGAILGKAMTALEDGRGLVLVLVSLQ